MGEIVNCSRCGELYMENTFRDVCPKCAKEEEQMYEIVYKFLRQRENRAATIERVVEVTGVSESLIHKWMKKADSMQPIFRTSAIHATVAELLLIKVKYVEIARATLKAS